MLCSFVPVSLCVLFEGSLHIYSLTSLHTDYFWTSQALFTIFKPEDVLHFLQKQTNEADRLISNLMDFLGWLEKLRRPSSQTTWLK
eukprot:987277-Pelagomonas_calceolata.AAC.1